MRVEDFFEEEIFDLEKLSKEDFKIHLKQYKSVVLWGAGNLGTAIGKEMLELGIKIDNYWDQKADQLKIVNGIEVLEPFIGNFEKDNTLVVICIVNGSNGDKWSQQQLLERNFRHYILGMQLYENLVCPLDEENSVIDHRLCLNNAICSLCNCKKFTRMIERKENHQYDEIVMQALTFVISTNCSLECTYCGQRLNEYSKDRKINFQLENIKRDIDNALECIDAVGMISIIGGEPFLHPDLDKIIQHLLTKKNFGAINITTNGVCKITEGLLESINNKRIKISFSDYTDFLSEGQKELFKLNLKCVKKSGISYSVGKPLWYIPAEVAFQNYSEEHLVEMKKNCENRRLCSSIIDGKYISCSIAEVINGLSIQDIEAETVDIKDRENLKERLKSFLDQPNYNVCNYCSQKESRQIPAGQQK